MEKPKLPVKEFIAHLRRQAVSEIISDECLAAFSNVEAQYGNKFTSVSGFEVKLGNPAHYVDYILTAAEKNIPLVDFIWVEIDYEQFAADKKIKPCFFINVTPKDGDYTEFWDKVLPIFMGEQRARKLRSPLDKLTASLPECASIKQIGTMTGRGELDLMRIYLSLRKWEDIYPTLEKIGWKGDIKSLWAAIEPWHESFGAGIAFDLSEKGVHDKIGVELFLRWRHPLLIDRFIARLEKSGLCLKSKGDALRRWIRILPDAEPFIQTDIHYFKLNYLDGKIIEAKAYIEQTPHLIHNYFPNYYRPLYVEFMLKDEKNTLPISTAMKYLYDCEENNIRRVKFLGDVASYECLDRLLNVCKENKLVATVELSGKITRGQLTDMIAAGASEFITDIENSALKILQELGFANVKAKWFVDDKNFRDIKNIIELAESLGVKELIITGMKPHDVKKSAPSREALEQIANFISAYEKNSTQMKLSVEPCFSVLKAFMGGEDPKKNPNRGINRGCTAGRNHFCITATGKFSPCKFITDEESNSIIDYWEKSSTLKNFRAYESPCTNCAYKRRCLPCPALKTQNCPLASYDFTLYNAEKF